MATTVPAPGGLGLAGDQDDGGAGQVRRHVETSDDEVPEVHRHQGCTCGWWGFRGIGGGSLRGLAALHDKSTNYTLRA